MITASIPDALLVLIVIFPSVGFGKSVIECLKLFSEIPVVELLNFSMNTSPMPEAVRLSTPGPGSKSTVLSKYPVV